MTCGVVVGSSDGNGCVSVSHGLGVKPRCVIVTLWTGGMNDALGKIIVPAVHSINATIFEARFRRTDTNEWAANQPLQFFWVAIA